MQSSTQPSTSPLRGRKQLLLGLGLLALVVLGAGLSAISQTPESDTRIALAIGEVPSIAAHINQAEIEGGRVPLAGLISAGNALFTASFNTLDGAGRPESNGAGEPAVRARRQYPDNFNRVSAPDGSACIGCHSLPRPGGGGDNVTNAFVLANARDFVTTADAASGNERNPPGLFGSGAIDMLGREMTADLQAMRESAVRDSFASGIPITVPLVSKGVFFGTITARPNGSVDTRRVEGVDPDLIIKPFSLKGVVPSVRAFTVAAFNQHHGMQTIERVGEGIDLDKDGYVNEVTNGDVTATTIFQAALPIPGRVIPRSPAVEQAIRQGETTFNDIGCADCHRPALLLNNPIYSEPNPYNPRRTLQPRDVTKPFAFDLTREGPGPRLERLSDGRAIVRAFTDLKRHRMGPLLNNETLLQEGVPTDAYITRKLWGIASEPPFLHNGRATTFTEAILLHGGEGQEARDVFAALDKPGRDAVITFLRSLQILPANAASLVIDETGRAR